MCRFLVFTTLWLGLLGFAALSIACAIQAPGHDCCPASSSTPCDSGERNACMPGDPLPGCVNAPLAQPVAASIGRPEGGLLDAPPGSPAGAFLAWPSTADTAIAPLHTRSRFTVPGSAADLRIYLQTGRLRL